MEWIVLEGVRPCLKSDQGTVIHSLRTHRTELKYGTRGADQGGATNVAIKTRESIELVQFISKWSDSQRLQVHICFCAAIQKQTASHNDAIMRAQRMYGTRNVDVYMTQETVPDLTECELNGIELNGMWSAWAATLASARGE